MKSNRVWLYDTTLRDGAQHEGIAFSAEDKIRIAQRLDEFGIDYIEGGWPGSNPKDLEFFRRAAQIKWKHAKISAFGSTCRVKSSVKQDANIQALLKAHTPVVTVFGKSWDLHVHEALRASLEENLQIIHDSVAYLKSKGKEVIYDAEHFFDGFAENPDYALETCVTAWDAGADVVVLCDTNGGALPFQVEEVIRRVREAFPDMPLGLHAHNDSDTAVSSTVAAVRLGVGHVQGTINGYGERCGNANLCSILPNLQLKMGCSFQKRIKLEKLTQLSRYVSEIANLTHREEMPYVGNSAFAHKGGIHVSAIHRNRRTYEHILPESVGNRQRVLVSDQAGQSNVLYKAREMGLDLDSRKEEVRKIVQELKKLEHLGYQFEGAEGSFEVLVRKTIGEVKPFFTMLSARVTVDRTENGFLYAEAVLKLEVNGKIEHTVAEGHGPVDALDKALRKALLPFYPSLKAVKLVDYKVRVLDSEKATAAEVRVFVESSDGRETWGTVGVSENIIEASWRALVDSISFKLMKSKQR